MLISILESVDPTDQFEDYFMVDPEAAPPVTTDGWTDDAVKDLCGLHFPRLAEFNSMKLPGKRKVNGVNMLLEHS